MLQEKNSFEGLTVTDTTHGRGLYNYRFSIPFYQAAYDAYKRTEITGGLYVPILQFNGGDCSTIPKCEKSDTRTGSRQHESCRTTSVQLTEGFQEILENNTAFSLVDSNL